MTAENDNPAPPRVIPIIGFVRDDVVTVTRPDLMPKVEPRAGIEPASTDYETAALPLS